MAGIYFRTFGCSTNFSEAEAMKGLLVTKGRFEITDNEERAFVIIVSICTVKTDTLALKEIKRIKENYPEKKVIVAGCIPSHLVREIRKTAPDCSMISTHNIKDIVMVVEETINDNPVAVLKHRGDIKINIPKIRRNKIIGIVPISNSCLGNCSYCIVKNIKGNFYSYPEEIIINEINKCLNEGCKEIWVTAQDTGAYGRDINSDLTELLKKIVEIDKQFMVRVGMMNIENIRNRVNELVEIYKNKKLFKFLHIPVQSGNNEILKLMKRNYKISEFKEIINKFKKEIPEITISTDIICGFPTETKEQFAESRRLIDEIKPDVLNISRFRARPGTEAERLEQVDGGETKNRSRFLTSAFDWIAFEQNKKWRGWRGTVIIDEKGKDNTWVGRNYCYKPVILHGDLKLGDIVKVEITDITKHDLRGIQIN